jgi:putative thioredoxin
MNSGDNPYGNGGAYRVNAPEPTGGSAAPAAGMAGAASDAVVDTTTARFQADVVQASRERTVLVDFWAPWCGPCKQLAPVLEKVVRESNGAVKLVKLNIDDHPAIPGQLGIQSIPAVIAFRDGRPVDGFMGAIPESQIRDFVKRAGGGEAQDPVAEALEAAEDARAGGDSAGAAQIYSAVLQHAPDNPQALAALAEFAFAQGDREAAASYLERVPERDRDAPQVAAVRAKIALADQVSELGDPAALEARLAQDPDDHQARFDLALIQNARGERQSAADNLLAIIKADRTWNDDAARAKLLELFDAWGPAESLTLATRRRLSSLLFS